jgi:hypothetical protein
MRPAPYQKSASPAEVVDYVVDMLASLAEMAEEAGETDLARSIRHAAMKGGAQRPPGLRAN